VSFCYSSAVHWPSTLAECSDQTASGEAMKAPTAVAQWGRRPRDYAMLAVATAALNGAVGVGTQSQTCSEEDRRAVRAEHFGELSANGGRDLEARVRRAR
jgi:hypothetical protein